MTITKEKKQEIIKEFQKVENDTGSTEVQIAILTHRIREITEHLKIHKKDFQGRRGLLMLVGQRKRLLQYLKDQKLESYKTLIEKLGIRK